jgi:putative membrane protein
MQWWCAAQGVRWEWTWQAYPGVWIVIALLAIGYARMWRAFSGRSGAEHAERWRLALGLLGIVLLWIAFDWPVGPLGAGFLASVHMIQYLLIGLLAPLFLILGTPYGAFEWLSTRRVAYAVVRVVTRPAIALAFYAVVTLVTHMPVVVDGLMPSQLGSFAIDMAWLFSGVVFWWPAVAPLPERPRFPPLLKGGYLFVSTLVHTPVSAYLVFTRYPLYGIYELAPPTGWVDALGDQQAAGAMMQVIGGLIIWAVIGTIVLRWMRRDAAPDVREEYA